MGFFGNIANRIRDYVRRDKEQVATMLAKGSTASGYPTTGYDLLQAYGYDVLSDYLRLEQDLLSRYVDYEEMDDAPELVQALTIFADNATQFDHSVGRTVWTHSKDSTIEQVLDDLFHRQLRIDEEIWEIARTVGKYGNCVARGSRVWGVGWAKEIERVSAQERVVVRRQDGSMGASQVVRPYANGQKKVLELCTKHRLVRVTEDHCVLAERANGNVEWVAARDLVVERYPSGDVKPGTDKLVICTRMPKGEVPSWEQLWGQDNPFETAWGNKGTPDELRLPERIDPEFCRLFGYLLGDGFFQAADNAANTNFCVALGDDQEINKKYDESFNRLGLRGFLTAEGNQRAYASVRWKRLLRAIGWIDGASNKRVPPWVYGLPEEHREAFLWGFIDADGWVSYPTTRGGKASYHFEIANIPLAEDLKCLIDGLGFISGNIRVRKRAPGFKIKSRVVKTTKPCATLTFRTDRFENDFVSERLLDVRVYGLEDVFDVEVADEAHSFVANGVVVHNSFEELLVTADGVRGLNFLPPPTVRRIEGPRGELYGFVQDFRGRFGYSPAEFQQIMATRSAMRQGGSSGFGSLEKITALEDWEVVHFRLRSKHRRSIYGQSILEGARWIWKRLMLLEDAAMIYRLERAPERYAYYVDVGDLPPQEALAYLQRIRQQHRKQKYVDPGTGKVGLKPSMIDQQQDFFVPVRQGVEATRIEVLGSPSWQAMDDIEYFRDKLFAAIGIPKAYLAQEQGVGRAVLASEDVMFARAVMRLQRELRNGLGKIARVHLSALNIDPNAAEYNIHMTVPSAIFELAQLEVRNARADLATRMQLFVSLHWILANVFNMSDEEIEIIFKQKKEDQERDAEAQAAAQAKMQGDVTRAQMQAQTDVQQQASAAQPPAPTAPPAQEPGGAPVAPQQQAAAEGRPLNGPFIIHRTPRPTNRGLTEQELFWSRNKEHEKRATDKLDELLKTDKRLEKRMMELGGLVEELRHSGHRRR